MTTGGVVVGEGGVEAGARVPQAPASSPAGLGRARRAVAAAQGRAMPERLCAMTQQIIAMASPRTQRVCDGRSGGFALAVDAVLQRYRPALD